MAQNNVERFVAICNKTNFDGHYIVTFSVPKEFLDKWDYPLATTFTTQNSYQIRLQAAAWYFLNKLDSVACVEKVYPENLFDVREYEVS